MKTRKEINQILIQKNKGLFIYAQVLLDILEEKNGQNVAMTVQQIADLFNLTRSVSRKKIADLTEIGVIYSRELEGFYVLSTNPLPEKIKTLHLV